MAGLDDEKCSDWSDRLNNEDRTRDEAFVRRVYPIDPMMLAFPLIETHNLAIGPQLAFQLQEAYEDIAHRYLDLSALLRTYVAQQRRMVERRHQRSSDDAEPPLRDSETS